MTRITLLCAAASAAASLCAFGLSAKAAEEYPPLAKPADASGFGRNYQRTMRLLADSTPQRHNKVKVLFYGQSITAGKWWKRVADDLRRRFPNADLDIRNKAISGFASQTLYRITENDIIPEYPDLVIFHVYGAHTTYEDLIASIRERTTAEVVIWTDHLTRSEKPNADGVYEDKGWTKFMAAFLPRVAAKYGCGLIDIREPWKRYVLANKLTPGDLVKDNVHLNDHGGYLAAELIQRELVCNRELPLGPSEGMVRDYVVGKDVKWAGGKLSLDFEGNRVDLIPTPTGQAKAAVKVAVDGKAPSELPGCYAHMRPSNAPGKWYPGTIRVTFTQRPLVEDWTARITSFDPKTKMFKFDVTGSKTGPDGSGVSNEDFTSKSGRVVIKAHVRPKAIPEQSDWRMGDNVPVGFEVKWKTVGMFVDRYLPPTVRDRTHEHAATVAQGFACGRHTLTLTRDGDGADGIAAARIYRPPVVSGKLRQPAGK